MHAKFPMQIARTHRHANQDCETQIVPKDIAEATSAARALCSKRRWTNLQHWALELPSPGDILTQILKVL